MTSGPVACGVGVIVTHRNRVLFGKRGARDTAFSWQLPGGWIEPGESPQQAAEREVLEETGLRLCEPRFVGVTNNVFSAHNHSISLYFEAECEDATALALIEGAACVAWEWKDWDEVTENLYLPLQMLRQTDYRPLFPDKNQTHISF